METILPVLDNKVLQEKANEFAMQGAISTIKEFYTGYNSPYVKGVREALDKTVLPGSFELPDIIALINQTLSAEITALSHEVIAKTYLPLVRTMLTRTEAEIPFSQLLKEFIELLDLTSEEDCGIDMQLDERYGWYNVKLWHSDDRHKKSNYDLTLHEQWETKKKPDKEKRYSIISLPREGAGTFDFITDNGKVTLPFTPDVLRDRFTSYCASLLICKTAIYIDTEEFSEDMFPERCHCD